MSETVQAQSVRKAATSRGVEGNIERGDALKAIDATSTFNASDQRIYAFYNLKSALNGYGRSVWTAVDVPSLQPNTILIDLRSETLPNLKHARFSLTQTTGWSPGKYKVDLYANENIVKTLFFTVV